MRDLEHRYVCSSKRERSRKGKTRVSFSDKIHLLKLTFPLHNVIILLLNLAENKCRKLIKMLNQYCRR